MKYPKIFTLLFCLSVTTFFAQRNFDEYNMLGLHGGLSWFNINTPHFTTQQGNGILAGFVTRGDVYENFDLEYGISFFQNKVDFLARDISGSGVATPQFVEYQLSGVQLKLMPGYNFIRHHLSIEAGPILNVNGKMKLNAQSLENLVLEGYNTLTASELEDVSRVHLHLAAGITGGFRNAKVNLQYQYGVTNLFARYNEAQALALEQPSGGFKGNTSAFIASVYFFF